MGFSDGRRITGVSTAQVARSARIGPHLMRVTFRGDDLARLPHRGHDHWVRLFLPRPDGTTDFTAVPHGFGLGGYLRYLTAKSGTRPPFRNYTLSAHRPEEAEVDIDFVAHGEHGVAGPWAAHARPGEQVAMIDQGCGFDPLGDDVPVFLVGDESALPAIAGILRDLPRTTTGTAILEVPDTGDQRALDAPAGVQVSWLVRTEPGDRPGRLALDAVRATTPAHPDALRAYLAGEQRLVAESRRHLVAAGVDKHRIAFTGYWRLGHAG